MKINPILAFAISLSILSCEFVNEEVDKPQMEGTFIRRSDSTKTEWSFTKAGEFLGTETWECDTIQTKANFEVLDSKLILTNVEIRTPTKNDCPPMMSLWERSLDHELKIKMIGSDTIKVYYACSQGRCSGMGLGIWVDFVKSK